MEAYARRLPETYGRQDYERDLVDPAMPHIRSRERFRDFYEELGRDPVQKAQDYVRDRMTFVEPRGRILELGCHVGFNLIHYAQRGHDVVGVDVSEELLLEARRRALLEPEPVWRRIRLMRGFIEDLEVTERFDTVLLLETLEHVIDPLPIVSKARDSLAATGTLFISAPSTRVGTYSHVRGLSVDHAIRLCHTVGLSIHRAYSEPFRGHYDTTYVVARHPHEADAKAR